MLSHRVPTLPPALSRLIAELDDSERLDRATLGAVIGRCDVSLDDVRSFVTPNAHAYARHRIARTERYEVLVMTWLPGQRSAPHDHGGSVCAFRVVAGHVSETGFASAIDGCVEPQQHYQIGAGDLVVDSSGGGVHALANADGATEPLVTLHVYAPPLAELRRFAIRPSGASIPAAFARHPVEGAPVIAIVGGGFCGSLVAAQLLRLASRVRRPAHIVIFDRQAALGEGPAYRTPDPQHLLNVPASNMSAWPDRPSDFVEWARGRDPAVEPFSFLERKAYGEYVRETLARCADEVSPEVSAQARRVEVAAIEAKPRGYSIVIEGGERVGADVVVVATGHRPPSDPLRGRFRGSRSRYIEDPWSSLVLSSIRPNERVALLGTGLTAIDVLLSVSRTQRAAPVFAISRHGFTPTAHADVPHRPRDMSAAVERLMAAPTARGLVAAVGDAIDEGDPAEWRAVIDGLRPHTARIWRGLPVVEAARFLRHVRAFWEVHRHRLAPAVAARVAALARRGTFVPLAGRAISAMGGDDGVSLEVRRRGAGATETLRVEWIVNCTGPAAGTEVDTAPVVRSLADAGVLERDRFGLGVRTDELGRALVGDRVRDDLFVLGTLRKADLWESTAVPELRAQAAIAAHRIAARVGWA